MYRNRAELSQIGLGGYSMVAPDGLSALREVAEEA
jgi:hypothetical protein